MDYILFNRYMSRRTLIIWAIETMLVFCCIFLSIVVHAGFHPSDLLYDVMFSKTLIMTATFLASYYFFKLYEPDLYSPKPQMLIKLTQGTILGAIVLLGIYFFFPDLKTGRGVLIANTLMLPPVITLWRYAFLKRLSIRLPEQRVMIIGSEELAKKVGTEIFKHRELGLRLVGFIDDDPAKLGVSIVNPGVIGNSQDIPRLVNAEGIDRIIVATPDRRAKLPMHELLDCKLRGITVEEGETFLERMTGKVLLHQLKPSWIVFSDGFRSMRSRKIMKRIFDLIFSIFWLIALSPLLLITAIIIKLESKGPVIFTQTRVGENGRLFNVYKFRSMRQDAESVTGPVWAGVVDDRVTKIGRLIRKLRIDELPQLINVFRGEMSFVGPRPERPFFVDQLKKDIPYYDTRSVVKPGITGWAQVRYKYGATIEDALEKLQYDLYYIKNMSPILDFMILLLTVKVVLTGKGAR